MRTEQITTLASYPMEYLAALEENLCQQTVRSWFFL
jgi:hypothetical protein